VLALVWGWAGHTDVHDRFVGLARQRESEGAHPRIQQGIARKDLVGSKQHVLEQVAKTAVFGPSAIIPPRAAMAIDTTGARRFSTTMTSRPLAKVRVRATSAACAGRVAANVERTTVTTTASARNPRTTNGGFDPDPRGSTSGRNLT
jgi:hypothetical protein